jgi:hypothetical protein
MPEDKLVVQTEDVVVDRRGFIYISDKNQGVWNLATRDRGHAETDADDEHLRN